MVIDVKLLHPAKTLLGIDVMPLPSVTDPKPVHPENAAFPSEVTELGIEMDVIPVLLNA